ncbi:hypothetical protein ACH4M4_23020 [Streptomyces sp. NPDC017254]|uniref:hypothetical protein n=1 Tax=unclassified Streptomyces TaxID=2593676 RepID=UPI00379D7529
MTLKEGQRVTLTVELELAGQLTAAAESPGESGAVVGFLSLAAGTSGTVEEVRDDRQESHEVREYLRLKSLLDDFGHQMPPGSRTQLEEQVGALEPAWIAYRDGRIPVRVRVRLDNGFVLHDTSEDLFAPA